ATTPSACRAATGSPSWPCGPTSSAPSSAGSRRSARDTTPATASSLPGSPPLLRPQGLAKDVLEAHPLRACREVPLAPAYLPHERGITEHVQRGLQALVLGKVHEDCGRSSLAGHDDLLLALLDAGDQLGQACLHFGNGKCSRHRRLLLVDQNSGRPYRGESVPIKGRGFPTTAAPGSPWTLSAATRGRPAATPRSRPRPRPPG